MNWAICCRCMLFPTIQATMRNLHDATSRSPRSTFCVRMAMSGSVEHCWKRQSSSATCQTDSHAGRGGSKHQLNLPKPKVRTADPLDAQQMSVREQDQGFKLGSYRDARRI